MGVFDDWLTEEKTAAELKKSVRTLRKWRREGKGPPYAHFGREVKYNKTVLAEHYKKTMVTPVRERRGRQRAA